MFRIILIIIFWVGLPLNTVQMLQWCKVQQSVSCWDWVTGNMLQGCPWYNILRAPLVLACGSWKSLGQATQSVSAMATLLGRWDLEGAAFVCGPTWQMKTGLPVGCVNCLSKGAFIPLVCAFEEREEDCTCGACTCLFPILPSHHWCPAVLQFALQAHVLLLARKIWANCASAKAPPKQVHNLDIYKADA